MRRVLACLVGLLAACAHQSAAPPPDVVDAVPVPSPVTASPQEPAWSLEPALAAARSLVGAHHVEVNGRRFRDDCSGFVRGVFSTLDLDLFALPEDHPEANGVLLIHEWVSLYGENHRRNVPNPGDLVYFDNTWDRNRDGVLDDPFTHIAIVDEVLPDGTFFVLHRVNRGVVREPMNVLRPHDHEDENGREINAWLRPKSRRDTPETPHLMGELFAGFGTVRRPSVLGVPHYDDVRLPAPEEDDLPPPPIPPVSER